MNDVDHAGIVKRWRLKLKQRLRANAKAQARVDAARRVLARHLDKVFRRRFGIDWAWGRPDIQALKKAGVTFACRYLSKDANKNLTLTQAVVLKNAGIDCVVVWETSANRALGGLVAGKSDARLAMAQAKACGKPDKAPIYFAVDFDATPQDQTYINDYFKGVGSVLGDTPIGAYGGYWVIKRLFDAKLIDYGWQTYAWSGGNWDKRAQLQQYSNGHILGGVSCDYNRTKKNDFGQWKPV